LSALGIEALAEGFGVFTQSVRLIFIEDSISAFTFSSGSFLGPATGFGAGITMRNTNRFTSLGSNLSLELKFLRKLTFGARFRHNV
jgi:hypothetical protein